MSQESQPNPVPNVIVKPPLLKPTNIEVKSEGENVLLVVGNSVLTMHYEDALKISQWIRLRAKEAKRLVGDTSRHWSAIGILDGIKV
jgi:hypothetical protein